MIKDVEKYSAELPDGTVIAGAPFYDWTPEELDAIRNRPKTIEDTIKLLLSAKEPIETAEWTAVKYMLQLKACLWSLLEIVQVMEHDIALASAGYCHQCGKTATCQHCGAHWKV
jgi:hypothetical protein